jgi:hypothetical protein
MRLKEATSSKEKMEDKLGWDPKIHKHKFIMSTYDNAGWRVWGGCFCWIQTVCSHSNVEDPEREASRFEDLSKGPSKAERWYL